VPIRNMQGFCSNHDFAKKITIVPFSAFTASIVLYPQNHMILQRYFSELSLDCPGARQ
jgi:hypothetical protein